MGLLPDGLESHDGLRGEILFPGDEDYMWWVESYEDDVDLPRRQALILAVGGLLTLAAILAVAGREKDYVAFEEEAEVVESLWRQTREKYDRGLRGVTNFPWPSKIDRANYESRLEAYSKSLAEIWRQPERFWTPFDEYSWQDMVEGSRAFYYGRPVQNVWRILEGVVEKENGLIDVNLYIISSEVLVSYFANRELPSGLAEVPRDILGRTLHQLGASEDISALRNDLPATVVMTYSLPLMVGFEGEVSRPEVFNSPVG